MAIPVVSEILTGIQFVINFFMDKAPKPIKFMFFLILLLLFGALIPFMVQMFGVHCTFDGDVVKVDTLKVLTNLNIAFIDSETNASTPQPITIGGLGENCLFEVCKGDYDRWINKDSDSCINETTYFTLASVTTSWAECFECDGDLNYTTIYGYGVLPDRENLCFGDGYRIPEDEQNWFQSSFCNPESRCMPPENYYFESDTGTYDCLNSETCGGNLTNFVPLIDEKLESANAKLIYTDNNDRSYKNLVMFKCDKNLNPQLTIYGIPIFDYKVWVLIMIIVIMVYALFQMKAHS